MSRASEFRAGYAAARREIRDDGWTKDLARRYLAETKLSEGSNRDFDEGFRAAVARRAGVESSKSNPRGKTRGLRKFLAKKFRSLRGYSGVKRLVMALRAARKAGYALRPRARRNPFETMSEAEAALGSGFSADAKITAQVIANAFQGGEAFTRQGLERESRPFFRLEGRTRAGEKARYNALGRGLRELLRGHYVTEQGPGLTGRGGWGADRFVGSPELEEKAAADRDLLAALEAERLIEGEIRAREDPVAAFLKVARAKPGKGRVYRPTIHRKKTKGHALPERTRARIRAAGYRVNPTLQDAAEAWARSKGLRVPERKSAAWDGLYTAWARSGMPMLRNAREKAKKAKSRHGEWTRRGRSEKSLRPRFGGISKAATEWLKKKFRALAAEGYKGAQRVAMALASARKAGYAIPKKNPLSKAEIRELERAARTLAKRSVQVRRAKAKARRRNPRSVSDKAVLEAFTEKKAAESKRYVSTGARLSVAGMGGDEVARWSGGRIVFAHASTRLVQGAQRAIRRLVPKNWLAEDRKNPKKARFEKKRKRLVEAASAAERLAFRRLTAAADAPGALRRGTQANRRAHALAEIHTKKVERLEKLRGGLIRSIKGGKATKSNPDDDEWFKATVSGLASALRRGSRVVIRVARVPMRGDYDRRGRYWGAGLPLFEVETEDGNVHHIRARDRTQALQGVGLAGGELRGRKRNERGGKATKSNPLSARDKAFLLIGNNGVREAVRIAEQRRAHARGHRDQVEERRWQAVLSQLAQIGRKLRNKRNPAQMLGVTALVNPNGKHFVVVSRRGRKWPGGRSVIVQARAGRDGKGQVIASVEARGDAGEGEAERAVRFTARSKGYVEWRQAENPKGKKRRRSSARPIAKRATRYGDLPARLKAKYRRTALMAARRDRCKLEDVPILWAKTPYRTKRGLLHHGNLHAVEYVFDARSPRSKFARARYRHAAGDNGRGKKKTKAQVVGIDPVTGQWIPVSTRGSRAGFSTERGLIG